MSVDFSLFLILSFSSQAFLAASSAAFLPLSSSFLIMAPAPTEGVIGAVLVEGVIVALSWYIGSEAVSLMKVTALQYL